MRKITVIALLIAIPVWLLLRGGDEPKPAAETVKPDRNEPYVSSNWLPIPDVTLPGRVKSQLDDINEERNRNLSTRLQGVEIAQPQEPQEDTDR